VIRDRRGHHGKKHSKIKGRGTVAASNPCLHKVFFGTSFFASGTDCKQLIEQMRFIACHLLPAATRYDRKLAPPVSAFAPRNRWRLGIGCHDHV
jgi:hypothetical protein